MIPLLLKSRKVGMSTDPWEFGIYKRPLQLFPEQVCPQVERRAGWF
jgi:hypothetical protein